MKLVVAVASLAFVLSSGVACAQFGKPGVSEQISLGDRAADDLRSHYKVLPDDDPRVVEVRRVGQRFLSSFKDKEDWHFTFDVLDDKQVNAFALPGGPTFFFSGLINKLDSEDELAGVMGHELTHVRKQHWAHQYAASQNRNLLINLGLIFIHANQDAAGLASVGEQTLFDLPFTRSEEHQADLGGYEMMTAAGYNPAGMVRVFQLLQTADKDHTPEFLSDHPSDKNRIQFLQDKIAHDPRTFPAETPMKFP